MAGLVAATNAATHPTPCEKGTTMADTVMGKMGEAGHAVAATAKRFGHALAERVEKAARWVKEKTGDAGDKTGEVVERAADTVKETGPDTKDQAGA
jgi:hypothetical protein